MQLDQLRDRLDGVHGSWERFKAQCPAHDDQVQSLTVWDAETHIGIKCFAGCTRRQVCESLGFWERDLYYDTEEPVKVEEAEAVYPYHDENGVLLYEVVRFPGKRLRPRRPNGEWGIEGVRRVLYRLPELIDKQRLRLEDNRWLRDTYVVEGEKDADRIRSLGVTATTPPFGAGKWKASYVKYFLGLRVVVVADRDGTRSDGSTPGLEHAREIAESLEGIAESVRIVQARAGKDVTDHLEAGFTLSELVDVD